MRKPGMDYTILFGAKHIQKMSQVYLVTGASRGLGKGFVAALLQRPDTTVIAAVRDTASAPERLSNLAAGSGSKLIVVKIDSESDTDAQTAVQTLEAGHAINHIDVVIANAAAAAPGAKVSDISINDIRQNFQVNAFAPLLLFQATWPLLQRSKSPKFIGISTCVATIGKMQDWAWPIASYGSSKAAMNYLVRKMHFENDELVTCVVHPG